MKVNYGGALMIGRTRKSIRENQAKKVREKTDEKGRNYGRCAKQ